MTTSRLCVGRALEKHAGNCSPFLDKLCQSPVNNSLFPEQWSKALLVPIHKKGSISDPDNYRGISLLSILSKCYTYVLNKRLEVWAENQGKVVEEQGGFRKGRSTVDHIFVMISNGRKGPGKIKRQAVCRFCGFP